MTLSLMLQAAEALEASTLRTLPDGRKASVALQMYGAKIVVGDGRVWVDDSW